MKAPRILAVITTAMLISHAGFAQDVRYTQEYNAPLRINPALMTTNDVLKGIINYRTQWANIDDGFNTYRFTCMYPLIRDESGKLDVGLNVNSDQAGAFNTLNISGAVSYGLKLGADHKLAAGMILGYGQKSIDVNGQTYDEQYVLGSFNESNPSNENLFNEQRSYPDLGGGVMYFFNPDDESVEIFAGVSVYHHNKPDESITGTETEMPILSHVYGGLKIIGDNLDITPNLRISKQGGAEEYSLGCYIDYKLNETMKIPVGLWYRYRSQDALAVMVGFVHEYFNVMYSYDIGSFDIIKAIPGSMAHEVTLGFTIDVGGKGSAAMSD
ncbi:MAG: PorP/SprF family type IX secretion system membrane protein [Flavobacteriales bacterium]|nr:PorP/SprF family type IX secretion system membrane protein [Flavobacteriales bacterium]